MRVVLDTNVLVSAMLSKRGVPADVVRRALARELIPLFDARTFEEYRGVLLRPSLGIAPEEISELLDSLSSAGELVDAAPLDLAHLPDPDDLPFIEVAVAGKADALVTGNRKHFPPECGAPVLSPRELVDLLEGPAVH